MCENIVETFNLTVTNAKYCPAYGTPPVDATWNLSIIDSVQANEYTSIYSAPGYGVGNFSTTVTVDTAQTLTPNNHMFIAIYNNASILSFCRVQLPMHFKME